MGRWEDAAILAVGGALGVNARHWLSTAIDGRLGPAFPWATLTINLTGSFALGFCAALPVPPDWPQYHQLRLLVMVGFLGGYTTFSTFSLQAVLLWERGGSSRPLAYLAASVLGGLIAVVLGALSARSLWGDS